MVKSTDEIVQEKLVSISDALEVKVEFVTNEANANVVHPAFNPDAMISKLLALLVYSGVSVPSTFAPGYNRVHADVEFWKAYIAEKTKPEEPPSCPSEDPKPNEPIATPEGADSGTGQPQ